MRPIIAGEFLWYQPFGAPTPRGYSVDLAMFGPLHAFRNDLCSLSGRLQA